MVGGGGPANFFGAPHRRAILMDNSAELTAGALRSKPEESIESAKELFFTRGYGDWQSMIEAEAALPESERIDYVTIVTPNDAHHGPAEAAASAGIGVLCEKPLTTTLDEARRLHQVVDAKKTPFVVAYTYTGFPMVMLAKDAGPGRGDRRGPQGRGLVSPGVARDEPRSRRPEAGEPGGSTRPRRGPRAAAATSAPTPTSSSGSSPACRPTVRVSARLTTFVKGRALDDDFTVLAELENGGIATIAASQITIGAQNDNGFRVCGTKGTLEWSITDHNVLKHYRGGPAGPALPPRRRVRLLPGLDQALHPRPLGPPRRASTRRWRTST